MFFMTDMEPKVALGFECGVDAVDLSEVLALPPAFFQKATKSLYLS